MMRTPFNPSRHRQRGLSLVEIMVALALGAVITVGIVQMFTANRATYQINTGQARLQENARFAMEFVTGSIRGAGYTGCSSRATVFNALNQVNGSVPFDFDMSEPLTGFRKAGDTDPAPAELPGDIPWDEIPAGNDVLVLKAVDGDGLNLVADMPNSSSVVFSQVPDDLTPFATGEVLMISDCTKAAVFQVTHSEVTSNGFQVQHNPGGSEFPGNSTQRLAQDDEPFGTDASVFVLRTEYYFVAPGAGTTDLGVDRPLALWRKRGTQAPVELVEGIESLQVLWGEDTSNNRVPNRYRQVGQVANWNDVVTLRVTLRANSVNRATEEGDGLLRRDFTKTVAVRNRT